MERPDDCDDSDSTTFPQAVEMCDTVDNDCDGSIDEGGAAVKRWYRDQDLDGYGTQSDTKNACEQPEGYTCVAGEDGLTPPRSPCAKTAATTTATASPTWRMRTARIHSEQHHMGCCDRG